MNLWWIPFLADSTFAAEVDWFLNGLYGAYFNNFCFREFWKCKIPRQNLTVLFVIGRIHFFNWRITKTFMVDEPPVNLLVEQGIFLWSKELARHDFLWSVIQVGESQLNLLSFNRQTWIKWATRGENPRPVCFHFNKQRTLKKCKLIDEDCLFAVD